MTNNTMNTTTEAKTSAEVIATPEMYLTSFNNTSYESVLNQLLEIQNLDPKYEASGTIKFMALCIRDLYKKNEGYENTIVQLTQIINDQAEFISTCLTALKNTEKQVDELDKIIYD